MDKGVGRAGEPEERRPETRIDTSKAKSGEGGKHAAAAAVKHTCIYIYTHIRACV